MEEIIKSRIYKRLALEADYSNEKLELVANSTDYVTIVYQLPNLGWLITYNGESVITIQKGVL